MEIFDYLDELQVDIKEKSPNEIEEKYFNLCCEFSGVDRATRIKQVELNEYVDDLKFGLEHSLKIAKEQKGKAVYFEYDLDNNWNGSFFICREYSQLVDGDDDWASKWMEVLDGPDLDKFANLYELNGFDLNEAAIGSTIYLISRTVTAFTKAYKSFSDESSIAVCIAFNDQDPIFRIEE